MTTSSGDRQAPHQPTRTAEELVQEIARLEPPAKEANEVHKQAVEELRRWRDKHERLGELEDRCQETFEALGELVLPLQRTLAALAQVDATRFTQEVKRLAMQGMEDVT